MDFFARLAVIMKVSQVSEGKVKLGRFNAVLDAYGAEPAHWPERERADALDFCRSSVAAARALAQARELDDALRDSGSYDIDIHPARFAQLHAKIMTDIHTLPKSWFERILGINLAPSQLWPSVAGLAIATVLGVAVGLSGWMQLDVSGDTDDLVASAIDMPAAGQ
jgi:hypothetical protein